MLRKLCIAIILLVATPAFATEKPHVLDKTIHAEKPYGEGRFTTMFMHVYNASLWTDAPNWSMDVPFALVLKYYLDIDGADLANRSIEEMQHAKAIPSDKLAAYKDQLLKLFPDVKEGDIIAAIYSPKKGLNFYYNDQPRGTITDADFAQRFLGIWLSPQTNEPKLRKALLGGK